MKKLMFAAALAAIGTAFAVDSANIVGYQEITVPNGYSMFTVTFKNPTNTVYDIKDIIICNSAGLEMNDDSSTSPSRRSRGKVSVQKMNVTTGGLYDDHAYKFTTQNGKGWCDGSTPLSYGDFTLANGEGFAVTSTQGDAVKFRVSGEVNLTPVSMAIPNGYSIIGNMTPKTIDVKDIKVLNSAGLEMNDDSTTTPTRRSRGKISVQKMNVTTGGLYDDHAYKFTTQSSKGWCDGSTALTIGALTLAPGETLAVTSTQGDTVYFQFPSPVSE